MNEIQTFEYIPTANNLKEIITKINNGSLCVEDEVSEVVRLRYGINNNTVSLFKELNQLANKYDIPEELKEIITLVAATDIHGLKIEALHLKNLKPDQAEKLFKLALIRKKNYEIN